MELMDILIFVLLGYILLRISGGLRCLRRRETFVGTNSLADSGLRQKLITELIPAIEDLRTTSNILFETQIDNIKGHNITKENAQEDLTNLIMNQRAGFESKLTTLIDQIEGMVKQY